MSLICDLVDCPEELNGVAGALSWRRYLTQEEISSLQQSGDIPPGDWFGVAYTTVKACSDHAISIDLAAYIHDSTCGAPAKCDCSVKDKGPLIGEDTI